MARDERDYHSYLLRLWRTTGMGGPAWHAMLENPHTGERHGFANLAELFTFLENKLLPRQSDLDKPDSATMGVALVYHDLRDGVPDEQDTSEQGPSS
jgi:hypothetical protein